MQYLEEKKAQLSEEVERLEKLKEDNEQICTLLKELEKKTEYDILVK